MNGAELERFKKQLRQQPCANCGREPGDPNPSFRIEADHVFPMARFAELGLAPSELDAAENLQPLCGPCNRYKSTWTHEELRGHRFIEWREPLDWRVAQGDPVRGDVIEWPKGFDWDTGEWVDHVLTDTDRKRWLDAMRGDRHDDAQVILDNAVRNEVRTRTDWVRGMLFDYPIRPVD